MQGGGRSTGSPASGGQETSSEEGDEDEPDSSSLNASHDKIAKLRAKKEKPIAVDQVWRSIASFTLSKVVIGQHCAQGQQDARQLVQLPTARHLESAPTDLAGGSCVQSNLDYRDGLEEAPKLSHS